jgi:hypothetical protein
VHAKSIAVLTSKTGVCNCTSGTGNEPRQLGQSSCVVGHGADPKG